MKKIFLLTCALCCALIVTSYAHAQSGAARGARKTVTTPDASVPAAATLPPSTLPSDAATLYEDAAGYADRKAEEFRRNQVPYTDQAQGLVLHQQRELAAQHVAQLVARGHLQGTDNYYLGLLYLLAGQSEQTPPLLRRFITESADANPEFLQRARFLLSMQAAGRTQYDEAEQMLAAYAQHEPRNVLELFRLHNALSNAYYGANKLEQGAAHADAAYHLVKDPQEKIADRALRALLIGKAGVALAQYKFKLKRDAEGVAVLEELLQLGLTLPAAHVYADAVDLLAEQGHLDAAARALDASAQSTTLAPEFDQITDWIDQKPTTLASLRGRVVLLDFWATWCAACQMTMPKLKTLHERFKQQGVVVLGVTQLYGRVKDAPLTPGEELGYLRVYKREQHIPYGFVVTPDETLKLHYGVRDIPTAVLIDKRGRIRFINVGASDTSDQALARAITKLLAEP
jgi:thiol-disulfide isomerase/thioredoxin